MPWAPLAGAQPADQGERFFPVLGSHQTHLEPCVQFGALQCGKGIDELEQAQGRDTAVGRDGARGTAACSPEEGISLQGDEKAYSFTSAAYV